MIVDFEDVTNLISEEKVNLKQYREQYEQTS